MTLSEEFLRRSFTDSYSRMARNPDGIYCAVSDVLEFLKVKEAQ